MDCTVKTAHRIAQNNYRQGVEQNEYQNCIKMYTTKMK